MKSSTAVPSFRNSGLLQTWNGNFASFAIAALTLVALPTGTVDLVTMTIFVTDTRYLERFVEIRRELFKDANENYPASTFIGVSSLPFPGVVVEIQGTAVVG